MLVTRPIFSDSNSGKQPSNLHVYHKMCTNTHRSKHFTMATLPTFTTSSTSDACMLKMTQCYVWRSDISCRDVKISWPEFSFLTTWSWHLRERGDMHIINSLQTHRQKHAQWAKHTTSHKIPFSHTHQTLEIKLLTKYWLLDFTE